WRLELEEHWDWSGWYWLWVYRKRPVIASLQGRAESRRGPGSRQTPEAVRATGRVRGAPGHVIAAGPATCHLPWTHAPLLARHLCGGYPGLKSEVTQILAAIAQSDPHAADRLLPRAYEELRKRAAQKPDQEKPGQTLPGCGGLSARTAGRAGSRCGRD